MTLKVSKVCSSRQEKDCNLTCEGACKAALGCLQIARYCRSCFCCDILPSHASDTMILLDQLQWGQLCDTTRFYERTSSVKWAPGRSCHGRWRVATDHTFVEDLLGV